MHCLLMCAEFKDDPYIYAFDSLKHIGIIDLLHEHNDFLSYVVWCLTNFHSLSGTLFDNILITDDPLIQHKIKSTQFSINLQCGCEHT